MPVPLRAPTPLRSPDTTRATLLAAIAVAALLVTHASDAHARSHRVVAQSADGSTTARTGVARAAPGGGGGGMLRGRSVTTDGQGNGSMRSGAVMVGPHGATAVRQGQSTRNADGTANHSSTIAAQGAQGAVQSTGTATRNADGSVTQGRTTTATSAATGNSVQASSSYNKDTGLNRSANCFDASGTAMACPARP